MDDLNIRQPQDRNLINLSQQWEIDYWTRQLGVSEAKLREAIRQVGNRVVDVKRHLGLAA